LRRAAHIKHQFDNAKLRALPERVFAKLAQAVFGGFLKIYKRCAGLS